MIFVAAESYPVKREHSLSKKIHLGETPRNDKWQDLSLIKPQVISTVRTGILAKTWQFQGDKKATKF